MRDSSLHESTYFDLHLFVKYLQMIKKGDSVERKLVMICMFIGTAIGGYIPTFFGADVFSFSSILGTVIGGFLGIWLANKLIG